MQPLINESGSSQEAYEKPSGEDTHAGGIHVVIGGVVIAGVVLADFVGSMLLIVPDPVVTPKVFLSAGSMLPDSVCESVAVTIGPPAQLASVAWVWMATP